MDKENMVKSVGRALEIIAIVSQARDGIGVTQIANEIGMSKSSVHRTLATLSAYGYIEQDKQTDQYKLGYTFLEMSSKLLDSIDLRAVAKPFLQQLESETNEVVHLVVYDEGEVVYIEKLEGYETLRTHSKVGNRAPMHCTSVGKVILAHLPTETATNILKRKGLTKHTVHTITNQDAFLEQLQTIKKNGYAFDLEENEIGITCIAAPIFDHTNTVVAAVSISGPSTRMTEARLTTLQTKITHAGEGISRKLGFINKRTTV